MLERTPVGIVVSLVVLVLSVFPAATSETDSDVEAPKPVAEVQREIESVVGTIVRVSSGGTTEQVLERIEQLESVAEGSRETLILQIALFLRDAQGTERSMAAAMLLKHLDFTSREVRDAVTPYLETDDAKLRRVFENMLVEYGKPGPLEQSRSLIEDGELDRAETLLLGLLEDPTLEAEALILLTHIANERADYKTGIEYGKRAVAAAPENSYAHLRYAQAVRTKLQQISRARAIFSVGPYKKGLAKAIELDPGNLEARSEQIGYLIHAPGIAGGSAEKARQAIDELERLDWREGMLQRAELFSKEENTSGLIDVYRQLVERYPKEEWLRQRLAFTLQNVERYREADEQFAALLDSEDPRLALTARYQLARSRIIGEYQQEQAAAYLLDYLERLDGIPAEGMPGKTHAYWRLGMAYEQLQRVEDARKAYERAIALDPDNDAARAALKNLSRG